MHETKIALTGCGWVTPSAFGSITHVLRHLADARKRGAENFGDTAGAFSAVPDEWRESLEGLSKELRLDRGGWLTALALTNALTDARLTLAEVDKTRIGLALGHGLAGQAGMIQFADDVRQQSKRFVSPIHFPQTVGNYAAGAIARGFDLRGPNVTIANEEASSAVALATAIDMIRDHRADYMVAGGIEPLTEPLATGLSCTGRRPAEGACLFVLEEASQAKARGIQPLGVITYDASERRATEGRLIRTRSGTPQPNDIFIEHWIGHCVGSGGAAALAAGIGAAQGLAVPVVRTTDPIECGETTLTIEPDEWANLKILLELDPTTEASGFLSVSDIGKRTE